MRQLFLPLPTLLYMGERMNDGHSMSCLGPQCGSCLEGTAQVVPTALRCCWFCCPKFRWLRQSILESPFTQILAVKAWPGELSNLFFPPFSTMVLDVLCRPQWAVLSQHSVHYTGFSNQGHFWHMHYMVRCDFPCGWSFETSGPVLSLPRETLLEVTTNLTPVCALQCVVQLNPSPMSAYTHTGVCSLPVNSGPQLFCLLTLSATTQSCLAHFQTQLSHGSPGVKT